MNKMIKGVIVLLLALLVLAACGGDDTTDNEASNGTSGDQVELEFFQFKSEAVREFDALIEKFEAENPNIKVVQNNSPDADTVLFSRLSQNDIPDVLTINGGVTFGEVARAGVLKDLSGDPLLDTVTDEYEDMLKRLSRTDELYAFPHSVNANGVIYNKTIFNDLGLEIPTTWDEFISLLDEIQAAGVNPLMSTYGEAWTILPPLNTIASNTHGMEFFDELEAGNTSFTDVYGEIAEKLLTLLPYAENDVFGSDYNMGNTAFANGEAAMYLQGVWALGPILEANPELEVGVFPMPATNGHNSIVSGVDVAIAIADDSDHPEEAQQFVEFLLQPENVEFYLETQRMFAAVDGAEQTDPALQELQPFFEVGDVLPFSDHYYPQGYAVEVMFQDYILGGSLEDLLAEMDSEYERLSQ
ncbi:ABC transporter substrate-binding protein [Halolactibacillus alkaliphilus]|uniref:ABC transporter substrate-binding protein n=1 Tax=Halolactibacillus alkaliphilus TaxID=442899 RepID=A0A511X239_9BACI|nr:extracellular solute-binding protein [Halolactibacillus alkaliphilus]GEN56993.1 ABC transporter substrate-binding protein [Halolactibacillus alkaliphilus]GGN71636.1 ABC transporter substrate-binding protein [Halolactibacillus alkaliphilus]SFO84928.1 raffinose/stachyose/melibiose transport system substrate-binding protein [Halolactibacillus alkaliphilus]